MKLNIEDIKIGDDVKVKAGTKDLDFEYQLMDNWQGKVVGIQKDEKLIQIEWDAETLLNIPEKYLNDIITGGYDYTLMTLEISELERANKRDDSDQIEEMESKFQAKLYWMELFEELTKSSKYRKIFQGVDLDDYNEVYQKWEEYLSQNLEFPIETEVIDSEIGRVRNGTKIKLLDIDDYDDMHGIFGIGKYGREVITFPICNLEAIDTKSKNYELLQDYSIWFANT